MGATVIILSYNHPEITARAVRSALACECEGVVLVHNGSEPRFVSRLQAEFPRVEHLVLEKNTGYSGGVNVGLERALGRTEWAVFMSNDCTLERLPRLPGAPAVVVPLILRKGSERIDSFGGGFLPERGFIFHNRSLGTVRDATSYVPGSGFAVHRAVFARAGGMDTALGTYWDDVDWSVRVQRAGFELRSDPNFVLRHYIGKTCHQNPLYSIYYFQRNRKRVSWKYTTHASRPWLAVRLTRSWARLGFNLLRKGRWRELKYLHRAVVD